MEYKHFYKQLENYIPTAAHFLEENPYFKEFFRNNAYELVYEFSDFLMMTLPQPRIEKYSKTNFYEIQKDVTGYANDIIDSLGFFPVSMEMRVLEEMEFYG